MRLDNLPRLTLWGMIAAGIALHGLTLGLMTFDSAAQQRFGLELQAWSCLPYVLAAALHLIGVRIGAIVGGTALALLIDIVGFLSVVVWPRDAQAALLLLFLPFWTTAVAFPVGFIVAYALTRYLDQKRGTSR